MRSSIWRKTVLVFSILTLTTSVCFADDALFKEARALQRSGSYDEAINAYKTYLSRPTDKDALTQEQHAMYTDALVQLMNTYQSKGEPEECISALKEVFASSPLLQKEYIRDYYSVLGYALSRTENMSQAEETTLKALTLPLHRATPERYFRDYAYAAAVFYSNPEYQDEVIDWCQEALVQAQSCKNTSGQQWVMSMLGSLYKRTGDLNGALELFQQSIDESRSRKDDLGVLNSLSSLVDLFLYWDIPEYADMYASEAIAVEKQMKAQNPMVSAQAYINKGRSLHQLGKTDSLSFYLEHARKLCEGLPYNSGMVDVNLLSGTCKTQAGGDSLASGIEELRIVTANGTTATRAKAFHQLAQTYLENGEGKEAEMALDSLYIILNQNDLPFQILHLDYEPVLSFYRNKGNHKKFEQYAGLMVQERKAFQGKKLNYNMVESIVELQTGSKLQELKIMRLQQANQRLWIIFGIVISVLIISIIVLLLFLQRKKYVKRIKHADDRHASMVEKLNRANDEKEKIAQEVKEFLTDKDNRQEVETLTPFVLKESGEIKFRQHFELLYPLFLPRLREKVPSVTRREELLSMLIALKQDNKKIAELLAIEPRSVLMLRHRFRQKIGMGTEFSLENFIEDLLD
jgi:tetratricopeptide (TPR) repeat protein